MSKDFTTVITVHKRRDAENILSWLKDVYDLEICELDATSGFTIEENRVVVVHEDDSVTDVPLGEGETLRVEVIG